MRRLLQFALLVASVILLPLCARANEAAQGWCEDGDTQVVTSGLTSTTTVQGSFPECTVTVYLHGTLTLATIYSDNSSTPLTNPFTAATNGQWEFYATQGRYDVVMSSAFGPVTLSDVLLFDPANPVFSGLATFSVGITGTGTLGTLTAGSGILGGNNAWIGNETHSGAETFSGGGSTGTLSLGSGALTTNTWTGIQTFSGAITGTGTIGSLQLGTALAANNAWTGNETHTGTETFVGITGTGTIGTIGLGTTALGAANAWTGNESHSGTETFNGPFHIGTSSCITFLFGGPALCATTGSTGVIQQTGTVNSSPLGAIACFDANDNTTNVGCRLSSYTVSTLPSASSAGVGTAVVVTDATTFTVGTCTGGGSDTMIAVSNGSTWSCH